MFLIPRKRIWTQQPQGGESIDWSNPITMDLAAAFVFSNGLRDAVSGLFAENKGCVFEKGPLGVCLRPVTAGIRVPWDMGFSSQDIAITIVETRTSFPSNYWMVCDNRESGIGYVYGYSSSLFNPSGTLTIPGYKVTTYCKSDFYQNGVRTAAAIGTSLIPKTGIRFFGRYTDEDPYTNTNIAALFVHRRNMSAAEHAALFRSPWQIFKAPDSHIFVPVSAGGGSTLNASASGGDVASGSASLSAQVALASVGVSTASGSAALAASVPLSAVGLSVASGSAAPSATVTISASGLAQAAGQAGLSASVLAQAAGAALASGNATLAAQLNALATGAAQAGGSANLSGGAAGSLSASGAAIAAGTAVLSVTVGLLAAGSALASGTATGSANAPGQVSATGGAAAGGAGVMSARVSITAAGFVQAMGQGAFSATVPLSAFGVVTASGYAHLTVDNGVVMVRAPSGYRTSLIAYNSTRPRQSITIRPISLNTRR